MKACELCGKWKRNLTGRFCCDCRDEIERFRASEPGRNETRKKGRYVVISDPDRDGGFRKGAEFSKIEMDEMLRFYSCTPGTVVKDRKAAGQRYRVVTGKSGQRMERES